MGNNNGNGFSVLNMAETYATENDVNVEELFKKHPVSGNIKAEAEAINPQNELTPVEAVELPKSVSDEKSRKKPWTPDARLVEGMSDIGAKPVTYSKEELAAKDTGDLKNIADDNALQSSREAMDDMNRKKANIDDAKKRFGIKHFQIPEGQFHAQIHNAAGDTNYKRAKDGLDKIFQEIVTTYPEFIREWEDPSKDPRNTKSTQEMDKTIPVQQLVDHPRPIPQQSIDQPTPSEEHPLVNNTGDGTIPALSSTEGTADTKVIINKKDLPEISWTKEEMDVIRRARSIELSIVEARELQYTNIEDLDDNAVDVVLSQYQRKANDVFGALPASKYRATFTGLTYTEILDLTHSQELNNLDGERKKWAIAFDHVKNQSIGPWQEYKYYIDPETKKKIILSINAPDPTIPNIKIYTMSKFDDFLSKTSFIDLEYILWKTLCATAMDKEIISIDCHGILPNKIPCKHSYDWIYSPNELLLTNSVSPAVMEEMKKTSEVSSIEDIQNNYKEAMLNTNNTVVLPSSNISVVFGHISAYDYLNYVYGEINSLDENNFMASEVLTHSTLTVLKSFLVPKGNNEYSRIKGAKNIIKMINSLDEIDFQTISELMRIMIEPYQFRFALRDICCPKCKTKSSINIESMTRLLFIVAQSLSSVQVVLKRT